MTIYKTAESVSPRHPDKICDQISDAILDEYLRKDPSARVAVDVAGGHGIVYITGEITSKTKDINATQIAKSIAGTDIKIIENLAQQSPEIANGVDTGGAGDQGIMTGYATSETPELLPREYVLARRLNQHLYNLWPFDGKTQVTLKDGKIETIVASFQNAPHAQLREAVKEWLASRGSRPEDITLHINPAGDWSIGGFDADAGLTGRKLAVDNYGPRIPLGGGAFSGKDPSKVDRSGSYMARKIAIDYLRKYQANEVFVTLAYAIGFDQPVQATAVVDGKIVPITDYDLSPRGIIAQLNLNKPIYLKTARYGHFGHPELPWDI